MNIIKSKKQMYLVIAAFALILLLGGTTYAFFNYTRTGGANTIKTGRISFNTTQETINLTNAFPITSNEASEANNPNASTISITVTGDTDYSEGMEYLITAQDVHTSVGSVPNQKAIPLAIEIGVEEDINNPNITLGDIESGDYYALRTSYKNNGTSKYKVVYDQGLDEGDRIIVGYIAPNATAGTPSGINGVIKMKTYIDASKILISDTYPAGTVRTVKSNLSESEINACKSALSSLGTTEEVTAFCNGSGTINFNETGKTLQEALNENLLTTAQVNGLLNGGVITEYSNGTSEALAAGKTVFTTSEWNSLNNEGISFKIRIEAREGIWVPNPGSAPMVIDNSNESETMIPTAIRTVEITPNGDGQITCSSSNTSVATCEIVDTPTVSQTGNEIVDAEVNLGEIDQSKVKVQKLDNTVGTKYARITAVGVGNATITIRQAAGREYAQEKVMTYNVTVEKLSTTMSLSANSGTITEGESETATITTNGDGALSCSSNSAHATCSISGTTLTINGVSAGSATITVSQAAGTTHLAPIDVTYTATIEPSTVTINYNAGEGTVSPASKTMQASSTTYGELATPTPPTNYAFNGWYTAQTGGVEVTASTTYTHGTSPTTLYAHYREPLAIDKIKASINSKSNVTTQPDAEGVVFLKGTEETIDFNYVWYSGKLWRIVAMYPDETMKLVTENPMTAIYWGATNSGVAFNGSYVDQWLSQEFLPTLYNNSNIIVQNAEWNVTETDATTNPYQLENSTTINKTVGLLNAYEYMQTKPSSGYSYLSIGQYWWLMNPYNSSNVRYVDCFGDVDSLSPSGSARAARPSIYLKSSVKFKDGDGTRNNPYKIEGDIAQATANANLNTRISGEYISINDQLYRIVGIENISGNNVTKVVKTDYITNPNSDKSNKTVGKFGTDAYYNTASNDLKYWDKYLTDSSVDGWLSSQGAPSTSLLVNGTFYQGQYAVGASYKATICATVDANTSASACTPITGANTSYTGLVGLLRVGEMHAAQQSTTIHINSLSSYKTMWLMNPYSSSNVRYVNEDGNVSNGSPSSNANAARPSIYLSYSVKIVSGGGTVNNPYIVSAS